MALVDRYLSELPDELGNCTDPEAELLRRIGEYDTAIADNHPLTPSFRERRQRLVSKLFDLIRERLT